MPSTIERAARRSRAAARAHLEVFWRGIELRVTEDHSRRDVAVVHHPKALVAARLPASVKFQNRSIRRKLRQDGYGWETGRLVASHARRFRVVDRSSQPSSITEMVEVQWGRCQVHDRLLVDPLFGEFFPVAGPIWTRASFAKRDLRIVPPLESERYHTLPRRVSLCSSVIAEGSEQPTCDAAVVANGNIDLNQANRRNGAGEAGNRSLISPVRIVIDKNIRLPLKRIFYNRQLFFRHRREKELDDIGAIGEVVESGWVRI